MFKFLLAPILFFNFELAYASGPMVLTEVKLFEDRCESGEATCLKLCYKAEDGFGGTGRCSEEVAVNTDDRKTVEEIRSILSDEKKKTDGKLSFALKEIHLKGEGLHRKFTIKDFKDLISLELSLRENKKSAQKPSSQAKPVVTDLSGTKSAK